MSMSGTWQLSLSLYLFCCDDSCGGADHYTCLSCLWIVACSERVMAYATILVRFAYFITGTADKESWEGCHGQGFCIIYSPVL